jgi:hypothetical protein
MQNFFAKTGAALVQFEGNFANLRLVSDSSVAIFGGRSNNNSSMAMLQFFSRKA